VSAVRTAIQAEAASAVRAVELGVATTMTFQFVAFDSAERHLGDCLIPELALRCTVIIRDVIKLAFERAVCHGLGPRVTALVEIRRILDVDHQVAFPVIEDKILGPVGLCKLHCRFHEHRVVVNIPSAFACGLVRRWRPAREREVDLRCFVTCIVANDPIASLDHDRGNGDVDAFVFRLEREGRYHLFWGQMREQELKVLLGRVGDRQTVELFDVLLTSESCHGFLSFLGNRIVDVTSYGYVTIS